MVRRRKQEPKAHSQRTHFKKRALERYGVDVNRHLYREMVEMIQNGKAVFIERQTNRIAAFWLYLEKPPYTGVKLRVIYDKERKTLVTALPPEGEINWMDADEREQSLYDD